MPPSPSPQGTVRPSAVVNEEIRRLWDEADPRVQLTGEARERYVRLRAEWAQAVRAEVVEAA